MKADCKPLAACAGSATTRKNNRLLVAGQITKLVVWLFLLQLTVPGAAIATGSSSTLIPISQVWKYNQRGVDLGTSWKDVDFLDDNWPAGPGLFGLDTRPIAEPFPEPFRTPLNIYPPEDTNQIMTYYFRTHFDFSGTTNNLVLPGGLLLDDGAVCYLNGAEIGRLRVPPGQTYSTPLTNEHQFFEGWYELMTFPVENLVEGDNVFAVEVHQSSYPGYSNVVFGLTLRAAWNEPPVILRQPTITGGIQGAPTTISAAASGAAPKYQWFKDGNPLASATNSRYSIVSTQPTNAGAYYLIASNAFGSITSSWVSLSVLPVSNSFALIAPVLVSGSDISLSFSQLLDAASGTNTANYEVTVLGTSNHLSFSTIQLSLNARAVRIRNVAPHDSQSSLLVSVHGVQNTTGSVLNTQVIHWGTLTNWTELVPLHASWRFWQDPLFEDLEGKWKGLNYDDSFWRGAAPAFFAGTNYSTSDPIDTRLPYIGPTYYFRTTFVLPNNLAMMGSSVNLSFAYRYGAVFYLNGAEIARLSMPLGPVDFRTQAWSPGGSPPGGPISMFASTTVLNLIPGTNVLAAEVHQIGTELIPLWPGSSPDLVFGVRMLANIQTRTLPPLSISRQENTAVMSWPVSTLALESAANPCGPWEPLAINTNSFALPSSAPMNYFRLRSW